MPLKHLLAGLLAVSFAGSAHATDYSKTLNAGQVTTVLPDPRGGGRIYERVVNVGTSGVAWCSRYDPAPAPNKAGSFPLAPYGDNLGRAVIEEFMQAPGAYVPALPLYCTADAGTATLTVEAQP